MFMDHTASMDCVGVCGPPEAGAMLMSLAFATTKGHGYPWSVRLPETMLMSVSRVATRGYVDVCDWCFH